MHQLCLTQARQREQGEKQARQAELHELSAKRAAHWPNTLQAQRELRARAIEVRVAAEEAARVEADKAEAALRVDERRRQLAVAAASLWQQSDRVKALAGAALLGEVLAERQLQIAGAMQAAEAARRADAAFLVSQRQRMEEEAAAEESRLQAATARAATLRNQQLAQLETLQQQILADRKEAWQEGQQLRLQAATDAAALEEADCAQRAAKAGQRTAAERANVALAAARAQEREREQAADAAIAEHARRKQAALAERVRVDREKAAAKEAQRVRLVHIMETQFAAASLKTHARLAHSAAGDHARGVAAGDRADVHAGSERRCQWAARHEDRRIEDKRVAASAARQAELEADRRMEATRAAEAEAACAARASRRQQSDFVQHQIKRKAELATQAACQAQQEDAARLAGLAADTREFQAFAAAAVAELASQGRPVGPMQLHLASLPAKERRLQMCKIL